MSFILVLLIVFCAIWLRNVLEQILCNIKEIKDIKKPCSLHDWVINEEKNKLECSQCGLNG